MYMANGTNTTNVTFATSYVYHIRLTRLINGPSVANIMVSKITKAIIAVELPTAV
jgi:hypothetical protein